jgi:hypothetical protein
VTGGLAGPLLWILLALFLLRVAGQVIVVVARPGWLPPMAQWYSGLLPYPYLLPAQILILALMALIATGVSFHAGPFVQRQRAVGFALLVVSLLYAGSMVLRYVLRMRRHPDQRWLGGTIPIVFHVVLAAFLFTFAAWQLS